MKQITISRLDEKIEYIKNFIEQKLFPEKIGQYKCCQKKKCTGKSKKKSCTCQNEDQISAKKDLRYRIKTVKNKLKIMIGKITPNLAQVIVDQLRCMGFKLIEKKQKLKYYFRLQFSYQI